MKKSPISFCSVIAALVLLVCCAAPGLPQRAAGNDIHRVDFRNFTYRPSCLEGDTPGKSEAVKVTNGSFSRSDPDNALNFEIRRIDYGDLTRDGRDEAVVLTTCNTGGTGQFSEGFVYGMQNGKPALLARLGGGDRANGTIRCVRVESELVKVERLGTLTGRAIGVDFIETTAYRLSGHRLAKTGRAARRDFRSSATAKAVHFERGKDSAILTGTAKTIVEYAVRAAAEQRMTIRITSKQNNAAFEIIIDDYTMACRSTEWSGKLESNGEYRIVVIPAKGIADYKLEVTIH
ncbi:MAG: hypothetical protein AABN34_05980 [Acidobacteriota bacterium]